MSRLADIRKREQDAQPGPWVRDFVTVTSPDNEMYLHFSSGGYDATQDELDADFIAHSRQDVPYLLDLIDQQSEAINRAWNVLEDYIDETSHIGIPEKHDIGKARSILVSVIDEVGE